MKIAPPEVDSASRDDRRRNLDALQVRLFAPAHRPCADCSIPCPCSKSPVCACACTPSCAEAPARLSSDPVENPIEGRILGLVMALAKTDVLIPCWSCEGHARADGTMHRLPQVWFYCNSLLAIAVLDEAVQSLRDARQISCRWRLRAVSGLPRLENAFSLEPEIDIDRGATLYELQTDAARLSESLPASLRVALNTHKRELNSSARD